MRPRRAWGLLWPALLGLLLVPGVLPRLLAPLAGGELPDLGDTPLWRLAAVHLALVLGAEALVLLLGVPLAVLVTRPGRAALTALTEAFTGLGQTVPTLAILALAVPTLGLGLPPTLLGLVLYGLVPVVSNGIAGFQSIDPALRDVARGMGMTPRQQLYRVEFPLSFPVLMAGIRTSTVYNVGTATVGAALGAGGLGLLIINGLSRQNTALVLAGAVLSALLALSLNTLLGWLASRV